VFPTIAIVYAVFAAGLLLGFGGAALWAVAACTMSLAMAAWRRSQELALFAVLGGGAVLWAATSRRTAESCLTVIATRQTWVVDLEGDPAGNWWRGR